MADDELDPYVDGYRSGFLAGYGDGVEDGRFQGYADAKHRALRAALDDAEMREKIVEYLGEP